MYQKRKEKAMSKNDNRDGCEKNSINWFPGHMAKTERKIRENLKLCDVVAEVLDARIPKSSSNPKIDKIINQKRRIIILNKADMADPKQTERWINYYKQKGIAAIQLDSKSGKGVNRFVTEVQKVMQDKITTWKSKGMSIRKIRVMIVGIPNVGKSSLINKLIKKKKAKAEDRPGVTRVQQWFSVERDLELLDTPGVLWPKFDSKSTGINLAVTGAIKDEILDVEELAFTFAEFLREKYAKNLILRYKLENEDITEMNGRELIDLIGKKRGMLLCGGKTNTRQVSIMLLDEFRSSKLGNITLERVEQQREVK